MKIRLVPVILFACAILGLSLSACKHEPDFVPKPSLSSNCDPDTVYFVNDILPLLRSSCGTTGCHNEQSAEEGIILTDYTHIMNSHVIKPFKPNDSKIIEVITESDPDDKMPPPPKPGLTPDMIQLIEKWISQGAQNNQCVSDDCDTTNVTFSGTIWPIISNTCKGCHSGSAPDGGIRLENYNDVSSLIPSGTLLGAVTWANGYQPMPYGGARLSDCKIDQLKIWINNGYPND